MSQRRTTRSVRSDRPAAATFGLSALLFFATVGEVRAAPVPVPAPDPGLATTAAASLVPAIEPSRTSGVAPLVVFFDATGTTSTATDRPFHEILYMWSFGDPGSGTWRPTGKSRNTATGPVAAHVFETPGTYTVTLAARDTVDRVNVTVEITVEDPNVVFADELTVVVSRTGNFADAPSGAEKVSTTSLSEALSHAGPGKRLLFRRGESWTNLVKRTLNMPGPGIIGSFGSGGRPIIHTTGTTLFELSGGTPIVNDWRIMGLEMTGPGEKIFEAEGTVKNLLVLDCDMHDIGKAFEATTNILDFWAHNGARDTEMHDLIAIVDTDAKRGDYGQLGMIASQRLIFMGNDWERAASHTLRLMYVGKGVISNSRLAHASEFDASTVELKFHSTDWNDSLVAPQIYSEAVVISDNVFESHSSEWQAVLGPQSGNDSDERLRNIIVERNQFCAGAFSRILLRISAVDTTVRNNIFDLSHSPDCTGVSISPRSTEPPPDLCVVANNNFYRSDAAAFKAVDIAPASHNTVVKNNLCSAPHSTGAIVLDDHGKNTDAANNEMADLPGWASAQPTRPEHYLLQPHSPAIDGGVPVSCVLADFTGRPVPRDGDDSGSAELDLGAFEF